MVPDLILISDCNPEIKFSNLNPGIWDWEICNPAISGSQYGIRRTNWLLFWYLQ